LKAEAAFKKLGIDEIIVFCINDGAVMSAWAKDQGVGLDGEGSMINFLSDPHGVLTDALDVRMAHDGPHSLFGVHRCKRFSAFVEDGVLRVFNVAESHDDPAGDDFPTASLAEKMLADIAGLQTKQ